MLHLIVEIKNYRSEDAKEKKATMEARWMPVVNNLGVYGHWAFAEHTILNEQPRLWLADYAASKL